MFSKKGPKHKGKGPKKDEKLAEKKGKGPKKNSDKKEN